MHKGNSRQTKVHLDRIGNTIRSMAAGVINKLCSLVLPFIVRTAIINRLGIEYAGLDSLFISILQVLNLAELGFSSAVVYSMYKPVAENDKSTICALLALYRKVYRIIGAIILGVGLAIMPALPHLIKGSWPPDINIYAVFLVFLSNSSISYLLYGYKTSLLEAHQRRDVISNISTLTTTLLNVGKLAVLFAFPNYYWIIILMPLFTVINNMLVSRTVDRMYPEYRCVGELPGEILADIRKKVTGLMMQRVCVITRNALDNIFIAAFISLSVTAVYSNYYMIMNMVVGFMALIPSSMLAGVGNSMQTDSVESNLASFKKFNFMYMWISGIATVCLACLYQPFVRLWLGEEHLMEYGAVLLLCVYFYVLKMGDIRCVYHDAAGLWWEARWRSVIEAVLNFALNFILVRLWGIKGVIAGTLISLFTINFLYNSTFVFRYYFGTGQLPGYLLKQLWYFMQTCLAFAATYGLARGVERAAQISNDWMILLERGILCLIVPNLLFLILNFLSRDFRDSATWLRTLTKRPAHA